MAAMQSAMPGEDALAGDVQRAPADLDGVGDAVDAVDEDDGVGGLRGDGRAGRAHGDADVGERERGRVVDAVADHDHRAQARLGSRSARTTSSFSSGVCSA